MTNHTPAQLVSILKQLGFSYSGERWELVDKGIKLHFYPDDEILYVFPGGAKVADMIEISTPDELMHQMHKLRMFG